MVEEAADAQRRWCREATDGLAVAVEAAPDAAVPAYPRWAVRDLALHVIRVYGNATIALHSGVLERPNPELPVVRDDEPPVLAGAVRRALHEAETALERCQHEVVWTPVGPRDPSFWQRRLLREAVLHRWDAEQADGVPSTPDDDQALELIDEFLDSDVVRALAEGDGERRGVVAIRSGQRSWTVDLARGSVAVGGDREAVIASISGDPPAVWLWLMRRDGLPGPAVDDADGSARTFTDLIDGFVRPAS